MNEKKKLNDLGLQISWLRWYYFDGNFKKSLTHCDSKNTFLYIYDIRWF